MTQLKTLDSIPMLVQRCELDQHRLIIPVSITKPHFRSDSFQNTFPNRHYRALVDTGAQRTVVSRTVIAEQDLMRTGHLEFASLHGPKTHSRYLAGIAFWARRVDGNEIAQQFENAELSLFSVEDPFEVVDMEDNSNFDLILGFDILKRFSFRFDSARGEFQLIVAG